MSEHMSDLQRLLLLIEWAVTIVVTTPIVVAMTPHHDR